ncbi:MAG TPA: DNA-3-methyladenine glycosylase [Baekduia sp.]|uniref:DNA-3-methyladenine glycosylase n=1 Tax=Baekduia sp. TaxID=2600305 RepID=UPI002D7882DE|nr:DNA-3-methyladenine glycosylase [Baekduia sp.]HET6506008.1 DNA-3-methyladenine glycosylase [Baekduia sp.]
MALPPSFYDRPVVEVARDLVGCVVEHAGCAGVIVETEAYHHSEPAAHSYVGLTARTSVLFSDPGKAYIYRSYGIHALLNAVCEHRSVGAAVLIRALEPIEGIERMRGRRGVAKDVDLCNGPGKLTQALGIDLELNDTNLYEGPILLHPREGAAPSLVVGERIGITKAVDLPWRFCAAGSRYVSRPWPPDLRETLCAPPRRA